MLETVTENRQKEWVVSRKSDELGKCMCDILRDLKTCFCRTDNEVNNSTKITNSTNETMSNGFVCKSAPEE